MFGPLSHCFYTTAVSVFDLSRPPLLLTLPFSPCLAFQCSTIWPVCRRGRLSMRAMECSFLTMVSNNIILCTCLHALLPLTPSSDFVDVSCCPLLSSLFALPVSSSSCRPVVFCHFFFFIFHPSFSLLFIPLLCSRFSGYAAAWWSCVCFCQMSAVVHGGGFCLRRLLLVS